MKNCFQQCYGGVFRGFMDDISAKTVERESVKQLCTKPELSAKAKHGSAYAS